MVPVFVNCSEPGRSEADQSEDDHLRFELQGQSEDRSGEADVNGMGINKYRSEDRGGEADVNGMGINKYRSEDRRLKSHVNGMGINKYRSEDRRLKSHVNGKRKFQ